MPSNINKLRIWIWRVIKLAAILAMVALAVYWVRFRPLVVEAEPAKRGPLVEEVFGTGTLEARIQVTISPRISGRIDQIMVDQGDTVSEGQLLFRLDDEELQQQVLIAEAEVATKQASVERMIIEKARAEAVLKQANQNFNRLEPLEAKNAVSSEELEKAIESQAIAQADTMRADAAIAEAKTTLIVAERNLAYQKTRMDDAKVHAPFDGLIVRRQRDLGDVVVAGASVLTLIATEELWISAWVDETAMAKIGPTQTARVLFRSDSETELPGKVARLSKETDRETREFIVDVTVLELPGNWAIGQRAEVYIEAGNKTDALTIPNQFLERRQGTLGVFVNEAGTARWTPVGTGIAGRHHVEITSGLAEDDVVVKSINPQRPLRDGQRIVQKP